MSFESSDPHVCSANTLSMRLPKWCQKRHQAPQGHHQVPLESGKGHCSCCTFALVIPHSTLERLAAAAGSGWSVFAAKEGSWGEARQSLCRPPLFCWVKSERLSISEEMTTVHCRFLNRSLACILKPIMIRSWKIIILKGSEENPGV